MLSLSLLNFAWTQVLRQASLQHRFSQLYSLKSRCTGSRTTQKVSHLLYDAQMGSTPSHCDLTQQFRRFPSNKSPLMESSSVKQPWSAWSIDDLVLIQVHSPMHGHGTHCRRHLTYVQGAPKLLQDHAVRSLKKCIANQGKQKIHSKSEGIVLQKNCYHRPVGDKLVSIKLSLERQINALVWWCHGLSPSELGILSPREDMGRLPWSQWSHLTTFLLEFENCKWHVVMVKPLMTVLVLIENTIGKNQD